LRKKKVDSSVFSINNPDTNKKIVPKPDPNPDPEKKNSDPQHWAPCGSGSAALKNTTFFQETKSVQIGFQTLDE
jgi:hypothetical protein